MHELEPPLDLGQPLAFAEGRPVVHQGVHDTTKSPYVDLSVDLVSLVEVELLRGPVEGRRDFFDLLGHILAIHLNQFAVVVLHGAAAEVTDLPVATLSLQDVFQLQVPVGHVMLMQMA